MAAAWGWEELELAVARSSEAVHECLRANVCSEAAAAGNAGGFSRMRGVLGL